jgi:hypothetical protein
MKILSSKLTTCRVIQDGGTIELQLLDESQRPVTLQLPFAQAEAIAMTLPSLLTSALRLWTGDQGARYVFGLGNWALESTKDQNCLIATLTTTDGFAACFGIPFDTCQALGWNLMQHAEEITEARQLADSEPDAGKLN